MAAARLGTSLRGLHASIGPRPAPGGHDLRIHERLRRAVGDDLEKSKTHRQQVGCFDLHRWLQMLPSFHHFTYFYM